MVNQTQTRTIIIKTQEVGGQRLKRAARDLSQINKGVQSTAASMLRFRRAFAAGIAAIGIRRLTRAVDSLQLLNDRIKVFTGSTEQAAETFEKLLNISRITRTSLDSLATTYNRVALATNELGLSNDALLASVTALQNTFRLSGATIAEAGAAAIQLSQGLSSGQLRGQELRSVLEQNAVFANILSEELQVTRGQLIKFAESGRITSDVVLRALGKNFDDLKQRTEGLGTTFGQSLQIALDRILFLLNKLNQEFDLSGRFARGVDFVLDGLDKIIFAFREFSKTEIFDGVKRFFDTFVKFGAAFAASPFIAQLLLAETRINNLDGTLVKFGSSRPERKIKNVATEIKRLEETLRTTQALPEAPLKRIAANIADFAFDLPKKFASKEFLNTVKKDLEALRKLRDLGIKDIPANKGFVKFLRDLQAGAEELAGQRGLVAPLKGVALLNDQFERGLLTLENFSQRFNQIEVDKLTARFEAGKLAVDKYYKSLLNVADAFSTIKQISIGARVGLTQVFEEANNVAKQTAAFVRNTFSTLEDTIFDFVKTGQFEFKKFTQAVLDDLTRIIIRASLIRPLANALVGGATIGTPQTLPASTEIGVTGGGVGVAAQGAVLQTGRVIPFQNGGAFVNGPTMFPLAGGRTGLMGEAGPEAILPLTRRNGRLGVEGGGASVEVNIINNAGAQVQTEERVGPNGDRQLDVIITNTVRGAIETGQLDRSLNSNFGIKRRGA